MDITNLLTPVSDDNPAGDDVNDTGALFELERLVMGKPESQFAQAEEADWRAVREKCEELLTQTRDIRVATIYTAALLRSDAIEGFTTGLSLIRGLLETYWENLHPRLDPDDNNDPQERINSLNALAAPIGTAGDPLKILETLHKTPVALSREAGNWGLDAILANKENRPLLNGEPAPNGATIDGAFSDTGPERLQATQTAIETAIEHTTAIVAYFTDTLAADASPTLAPLIKDLKRLHDAIAAHLGNENGDTTPENTSAGESPGSDSPTSTRSSADRRLAGEIACRDDVIRALELINTFYARNEPSSPIPLFINRIKRLVPMTFPQIIKELTPDAMERITLLTGFDENHSE